jgi:hypothetical protein
VQFSTASFNFRNPFMLSHYPSCNYRRFRLFPFRSPLLRKSLLLSLPPATKMFQFAGLALTRLWIQRAVSRLPYSDTSGSSLASSSSERFVGHHVLLRLCVPRDPPLALSSLTSHLKSLLRSYLLPDSLCSFPGSD